MKSMMRHDIIKCTCKNIRCIQIYSLSITRTYIRVTFFLLPMCGKSINAALFVFRLSFIGVDAIHVLPHIILFSADFRIDSTLCYPSLPYFNAIVNTVQ